MTLSMPLRQLQMRAQVRRDRRRLSPSTGLTSHRAKVSRKGRAKANRANHPHHLLNARREARPTGAGTIAAGPIVSGTSGTASGMDGSSVAGTGADPSYEPRLPYF